MIDEAKRWWLDRGGAESAEIGLAASGRPNGIDDKGGARR
jgi:hypothetical protein